MRKVRPLIYVASPLTDIPLNYLDWLGKMNNEAYRLAKLGYAPVIPGNDLLFCYRSPEPLEKELLLSLDEAYLSSCYAIRVLSEVRLDGVVSEGVAFELDRANEFGLIICRTFQQAVDAYIEWLKH